VHGHRGWARLAGLSPVLLATKYNENRAFHHKTAMVPGYNCVLFHCFMQQIRYSADQWNFAADQRIGAALSTEKQSNSCGP
jgi:hypothetical protein